MIDCIIASMAFLPPFLSPSLSARLGQVMLGYVRFRFVDRLGSVVRCFVVLLFLCYFIYIPPPLCRVLYRRCMYVCIGNVNDIYSFPFPSPSIHQSINKSLHLYLSIIYSISLQKVQVTI